LRVNKSEARYTARPVPKAVASVNSASVAASMQVNGHVLVVVKELKPFMHAALVLVCQHRLKRESVSSVWREPLSGNVRFGAH
jgi:hypothetical protein